MRCELLKTCSDDVVADVEISGRRVSHMKGHVSNVGQ